MKGSNYICGSGSSDGVFNLLKTYSTNLEELKMIVRNMQSKTLYFQPSQEFNSFGKIG
jgi:hypothetical protein